MDLIIEGPGVPGQGTIATLEEAALRSLAACGVCNDEIEISLTFVAPQEIQMMNRDYRGKDAVTDVLSFPLYEHPREIPARGPVLLGDIVICLAQAEAQAQEYGHDIDRELAFLFVHSMFHLLGYDHETPEGQKDMRQAEESVLEAIGLPRRE